MTGLNEERLKSYLKIILEIVDEECHVVAEPPLARTRIVAVEMPALHLERPTLLQLHLDTLDIKKEGEQHVVSEKKINKINGSI